ncbi:MAG: single-stranded DNA-binding protein [bacterium]|nr:single-stranded DNA-binding protein [bacterium]
MSSKKFTVNSVGPRIEEFLKPILEMARLRVTPEVSEPEARFPNFENPDILVNFSGPDLDILLANKGEVLLALEHLTMEAIGLSPREHSLVIFDANEYRMLRIEELRLSALTAAEKVTASHRPFRFSPMTSRERRILHLAVREVEEVRSESAGIGPGRGVVIYPADMPSQPAPPSFNTGRPPRRGRR